MSNKKKHTNQHTWEKASASRGLAASGRPRWALLHVYWFWGLEVETVAASWRCLGVGAGGRGRSASALRPFLQLECWETRERQVGEIDAIIPVGGFFSPTGWIVCRGGGVQMPCQRDLPPCFFLGGKCSPIQMEPVPPTSQIDVHGGPKSLLWWLNRGQGHGHVRNGVKIIYLYSCK